jgi:SPP1 gp7 family putative phage head morphogenesis protein
VTTIRQFTNDADKYVAGHIYALENKTVNDLYAQYERAYLNLQIQLEAIAKRYGTGETWSASDAAFRERTEALVSQIMAEMRSLTNQSASTTLGAATASYEASFYGRGWMVDQLSGGAAHIPLLPAEAVRAAILSPYKGSTFVDRWKGNDDEFQRRIRQSIVQSQINGETIYQAQKRIAGELGIDIGRKTDAAKASNSANFFRTQMIARTEIIRSSNLGAMALYEANKDVLSGWTWVTAHDDRTCPECAPLDGEHFDFGDKREQPPLHPNCRCSLVPDIKDKDLEAKIVGPRDTFLDWAQHKNISQSRYGQVYSLPAQKPPKQGQAA